MDFVMNDHPRVVLHRLHRTTRNFDRLLEFSLHDRPGHEDRKTEPIRSPNQIVAQQSFFSVCSSGSFGRPDLSP